MNILPLTYLGNIRYYTKLCLSECVIDIHEHYIKQSYRNRCDILTVNGPASLTVHTVKTGNWDKSAVRDIRIDYSKRWQHRHWQTMVSAYGNSPYFDFYAGDLEPFYRRRYDFLIDLNVGLMETLLRLMGASFSVKYSEKYIDPAEIGSGEMVDLRDAISPKPRLHRPDPAFRPEPYWQVFSDRMPFVPDLSVVDLLFCEGPGAMDILRASCLK